MLEVFTWLADWSTAQMGLDVNTHFGQAVHFFIEDITKIFVLLYVLVFVISLFRAQLSAERVRDYLSGKTQGELHSLLSFRPIVLTNGVVVLLFQLLFRVVIRFLKGIKTPDSSRQTSDKHTTKTTNTNEGGAL